MDKPRTIIRQPEKGATLGQLAAKESGQGALLAVLEDCGEDKPDFLSAIVAMNLIHWLPIDEYLAHPTEQYPGGMFGERPIMRKYGNQPLNYDIANSAAVIMKHLEYNKPAEMVKEKAKLLGLVLSTRIPPVRFAEHDLHSEQPPVDFSAEERAEYTKARHAVDGFVAKAREHTVDYQTSVAARR